MRRSARTTVAAVAAAMWMFPLCSYYPGVMAQTATPTAGPLAATVVSGSPSTIPSSVPTPSPTSSPSWTPTNGPTPLPYPRTPLVIDLMRYTPAVDENGTQIDLHIPTRDSDPGTRTIVFECTGLYEVWQVNSDVYESCDNTNLAGQIGVPQICQFVGEQLRYTTNFYAVGSTVYFASFSNGTRDSQNGPFVSGGLCSTGSKVKIHVINMLQSENLDEYGCYADSCSAARQCHTSVCNWGFCEAETPVAAGSDCTDSNVLTLADRCDASGQCGGEADYSFELKLVAINGATAAWPADGTVSGVGALALTGELSTDLTALGTPLPELNRVEFSKVSVGDTALFTFGVIDYVQFAPGQLALILSGLVGTEFLYPGSSFNVVVENITFVSDTPYPTTTGAPTMSTTLTVVSSTTSRSVTRPATTSETSNTGTSTVGNTGGPGVVNDSSSENDTAAGFPLVIVAGAAGGAVVLIILIVICCCCRKKSNRSKDDFMEGAKVTETKIDSATRDLLRSNGPAMSAHDAKNHNYLDVQSSEKSVEDQLRFTPGRTADPPAPPPKPPTSSTQDNYIDAENLESKPVQRRGPPEMDDYLDLSNNTPKLKKAPPAPHPKPLPETHNNPFVGGGPPKVPMMPPPLPSAPPPPDDDV